MKDFSNLEKVIPKIQEILTIYGLKVIAAIVVFVIGKLCARFFTNVVKKIMEKSKIDKTVITFTSNMTYLLMLAFVVIAALGQLGIQTTSLTAIIGAAGLAIGLALQGSLANFAAGILMMIFRPFKAGDFIEGAGVKGIVEEIQVFTTILNTPDNRTIIIPNAKLTSDNVVNYNSTPDRRIDMVFGIAYNSDIDTAKKIISEILDSDERILKQPAYKIAVSELADSSVNFIVRPWSKNEDYWNVYYDVTEKVKKAFDKGGIGIPFPQRDVHIYEHKK